MKFDIWDGLAGNDSPLSVQMRAPGVRHSVQAISTLEGGAAAGQAEVPFA